MAPDCITHDLSRLGVFGERVSLRAEYFLLLVTMACGLFGVPALVAVGLCVAGLSVSALPKYVALYPRARAAGATGLWVRTVALSMLNSAGTSAAAYMLGVGLGWLVARE